MRAPREPCKNEAPRVRKLDVCALDPWEPVGLVLDALDRLAPGEQLCVLIEREPFSLYRLLSNRAYAYCTRILTDATVEVTIWPSGAVASGSDPVARARCNAREACSL